MLLAQLPGSNTWLIGFAIGVELIVDGASLIGLASAIRTTYWLSGLRAAD